MKGYYAILFMAGLYCQGASAINCQVGTSRAYLNINNVRAALFNAGDVWRDSAFTSGLGGYEVPVGSGKSVFFAGGFWVGGFDVFTNLLIAAQTYRQGIINYWPGPLEDVQGGITEHSTCHAFNRHWKVNRDEINDFILLYQSSHSGIPVSEIHPNILYWPGRGNPYLMALPEFASVNLFRGMAPFVDMNQDNRYSPMDGDYPYILGDQMVWWVENDKGNTKQTGGVSPLGVGLEIRKSAYAFKGSVGDAMSHTTFYRYEVMNRGNMDIFNTYFGIWADPDLGYMGDDFVGCDVERSTGYVYNGDDWDDLPQGYGYHPPAAGIVVLQGPLADELDGIDNNRNGLIDEMDTIHFPDGEWVFGELIPMSKFVVYNTNAVIGGQPNSPQDYYNYMSGRWRNGQLINSPNSGLPISYMYPGCSDRTFGFDRGGGVPPAGTPMPDTTVWSEETDGNIPGDRRFLMSFGPFTLRAGGRNSILKAVVYERDSTIDVCPANSLLVKIDTIRQVFNTYVSPLPTGLCTECQLNKRPVENKLVEMFPNPAGEHLFMRRSSAEELNYAIYSIDGKLITKGYVSGADPCVNYEFEPSGFYKVPVTKYIFEDHRISLSDLASATYIIEITDKTGNRQVGKFIRSHR